MKLTLEVIKWIVLFFAFAVAVVIGAFLIVPGIFLLVLLGGLGKVATTFGGDDQGTISARQP